MPGARQVSHYLALVTDDWGTLDCTAPPAPVFTDGPDTTGAGLTPDTAYDIGDTVKVSLTCPFRPVTPIISAVVGTTVQLGASSEFRIRAGDIAGLTTAVRIPPPVVPTPTPAGTPTPTPTATPTATPTPTPTPVCLVVPDLTSASGGPETVAQARAEWAAAGFAGAFSPSGQNNKIVTGQAPGAGSCVPATSSMTVTHT